MPGQIFYYITQFPNQDVNIDQSIDLMYAYKGISDPDTLYLHEVIKTNDWPRFRLAQEKEIDDRMEGQNFSVIHKSQITKLAIVLPAVWELKWKRDIKSGSIKKYKARLNIDGSRMRQGVHYDHSYAPVASWNSIRMLLIMTAVHGWHTKTTRLC